MRCYFENTKAGRGSVTQRRSLSYASDSGLEIGKVGGVSRASMNNDMRCKCLEPEGRMDTVVRSDPGLVYGTQTLEEPLRGSNLPQLQRLSGGHK